MNLTNEELLTIYEALIDASNYRRGLQDYHLPKEYDALRKRIGDIILPESKSFVPESPNAYDSTDELNKTEKIITIVEKITI